jgi:hypothetical protein
MFRCARMSQTEGRGGVGTSAVLRRASCNDETLQSALWPWTLMM